MCSILSFKISLRSIDVISHTCRTLSKRATSGISDPWDTFGRVATYIIPECLPLIDFFEREKKRERQGGKHQCVRETLNHSNQGPLIDSSAHSTNYQLPETKRPGNTICWDKAQELLEETSWPINQAVFRVLLKHHVPERYPMLWHGHSSFLFYVCIMFCFVNVPQFYFSIVLFMDTGSF